MVGSNVLAMLEMKKPIHRQMAYMFLKLKKFQVLLLGGVSGALVPLTACLPLLGYLVIGAVYSVLAEAFVPGLTGFYGENFAF